MLELIESLAIILCVWSFFGFVSGCGCWLVGMQINAKWMNDHPCIYALPFGPFFWLFVGVCLVQPSKEEENK